MKRNAKFFTIVISLLLVSTLVLIGCMYAIAADNGEMKPYDLNGQTRRDAPDGNILEDAPLAQSAMQEKFNTYLHTDGSAVTVFSDEQYAQLKAIREGGKRTPLTYDEILFLVNDSINLYFTYDEIHLTNAVVDGISHNLYLSSNAEIIYPYHGDYSELKNYTEADHKYQKMLEDIYSIIYYRIYMHDAGFAKVFHAQDGQIWGESTADDPRDLIHFDRYQLLAIDGATDGGIANEEKLIKAYETLVEWEQMQKMDAVIDYAHYPYLESAVLYTQIQYSRGASFYEFFIAGPKDTPAQQIYPTVELLNKTPHREFVYQAGDETQPVFSLNYETGKAFMCASSLMSFAMVGEFDLHDGVLKMYFGDDKSYVFNESGNGFVYSKENSKPEKNTGFDFADGLVFECVRKGVNSSEH